MSTVGRSRVATDEEVLQAIRDDSKPFVRPADIANYCGCTKKTALKYLHNLADNGDIEMRQVGSGSVWWIDE